MSQMGGGVVFAVGDCFFFFHRSYSIIGFQEVWFESTEIEVVVHREHVQAMVRDRKTCLPVDSLWSNVIGYNLLELLEEGCFSPSRFFSSSRNG